MVLQMDTFVIPKIAWMIPSRLLPVICSARASMAMSCSHQLSSHTQPCLVGGSSTCCTICACACSGPSSTSLGPLPSDSRSARSASIDGVSTGLLQLFG